MTRWKLVVAGLACVAVGACDEAPDFVSEAGQLGVNVTSLEGMILERPEMEVRALVESQVCIELDGWLEDGADGGSYHVRDDGDDAWLRDCFAIAAAGGAHLDSDGCLALDQPGDAAFTLTPQSCALVDDGDVTFSADRLPVRSYALAEVGLDYDDTPVREIWEEMDPGPVDEFPARPPRRGAGEALSVVADTSLGVVLQPLAVEDGAAVGFSEGAAVAVGRDAPAMFDTFGSIGLFTIAVGQRFSVALDVAAGRLVGDEIVGVDGSTAATMEVVVGYDKCVGDDCGRRYGVPRKAVAIVRDAAGTRLHGAPVEWSIDGRLPTPETDALFPDAAFFSGVCDEDDAGRHKSAVLEATYRELVATAAIDFACPTEEDDDFDDDGFDDDGPEVVHDDRDDDLDFGCLCNTNGRGSPASLALLVLVALARPRRSLHPRA